MASKLETTMAIFLTSQSTLPDLSRHLIIAIGMAAAVMCWIVALEMHADLINKHLVYRPESGTWLIRRVIRDPNEL